jgi:bifunctional enzyme CysN/CysC
MSHQSSLIATDIDAYLLQHERKELLRFITCGSVDDGKSTLIGRLFYESKMIYEDQLAAIRKDSTRYGTTGEEVDLALFTDGLEDERQQGITIDVAYRYFSTDKRKFIIADTPGHVQYTRNMATGASTADLAIILIDARQGVLTQTKRHSFIVSLLGIKHIVVAVNKMDLVGYSEEVFERIKSDYQAFAARLELPDVHFMPISALKGDNVVRNSPNMPWYQGSPLVHFLETVYIGSDRNLSDLRFPVQLVLRPNLDFRGFAGTVSSGIIRKGDEVMVLPSRRTSRVKSISTFDGELEEAFALQSVTLTLEDEVDISRGDMIVRPGNVPRVEQRFEALIVWMHDEKLVPGKSYLFKQTTRVLTGAVNTLRYKVDVNTLHRQEAPALELNEIGRCQIVLTAPIAYDAYRSNRATGSFIIIDRLTNATVGAGMILDRETDQRRGSLWDAEPTSATLAEQISKVTSEERSARFGQQPVTLLLTGQPGAGKSSIAYALERRLFDEGRAAMVIDGQNLRRGLSRELSFDEAGRSENIRRAAEVAKVLNQAGLICILALVSPQEEIRQRARELVGTERFAIIHVTAQDDTCRARQAGKQLSAGAADETDVRFEPPTKPDLVLDTDRNSIADSVEQLMAFLDGRKLLG